MDYRHKPANIWVNFGRRSRVNIQSRLTICASNKPVRLNKQLRLQRRRIPNASRQEMMQLIVLPGSQARRHRLNTLPLTRPDQACDVERTHPSSRLVAETRQKKVRASAQAHDASSTHGPP
jgi:hypothetical protein